jgi:hypothetical protein
MTVTESHFAYRIDRWDADGKSVMEHVADIDDLTVAKAIYEAACKQWLDAPGSQSRSRKSGQGGKWSFCLTAGTLWPANQERPCRDDRAGTTHRP